MHYKDFKIIYIIISCLIVFTSCEEEYYADISSIIDDKSIIKSEIVINGSITSERKHHEVILTKPMYWNTTVADSIDDAVVYLEINGIRYDYYKDLNRKGVYISTDSINGIPEASHTLYVEYSGKVFTATDIMPKVSAFNFNEIDMPVKSGMITIDSIGPYDGLSIFPIKFNCDNNYIYNWECVYPNFPLGDENLNVYYFRINDQQATLSGALNSAGGTPFCFGRDMTITIRKHSISDSYANFLITYFKQVSWSNSLFATTPANIPSNVTNGGLGFFSATAVDKEIILAEELRAMIK